MPAESDLQSEIDTVITELCDSQSGADAGWEAILDVVSEQGSAPDAQRRLSPHDQTALAVRCAVAMQACNVRTDPLWSKAIDIVRRAEGSVGLDALATVTCALVKLNMDAPVLLDPIAARFDDLGKGDPPPMSERTYEMCLQRRSTLGSPEPATPNHAKVLCAAARSAASVAARSGAAAAKLVEAFEGHGTPSAAAIATTMFFALQPGNAGALKTVAATIRGPNVWLAVLPALERMDAGPRSTVWFSVRTYVNTIASYESFTPDGTKLAQDLASLEQLITQQALANLDALSFGQAITFLANLSGADAMRLADHVLSRLSANPDVSLILSLADAMLRADVAGNSSLWQRLLDLPCEPAQSVTLMKKVADHIAVRPAARSGLLTPLLQRALAAPVDGGLAALCVHIRQCVGQFPEGSTLSDHDRKLLERFTDQVVQSAGALTLEHSMALVEVLAGDAAGQVAAQVLSKLGTASDVSLMCRVANVMMRGRITSSSPLWEGLLNLAQDAAQSAALVEHLIDLIGADPAARSWVWATVPAGVVQNIGGLSLRRAMTLLKVLSGGAVADEVAVHVLSMLSATSGASLTREVGDAMLRGGISLDSPLWQRLLALPNTPAQTLAFISQLLNSEVGEKPEGARLCFRKGWQMGSQHQASVLDVLRAYFSLPSTEQAFTGAAALSSLSDVLAIALGTSGPAHPHAAFRRLSAFHGAIVSLNSASPQWPSSYRPVWKQVISNASSHGSLQLASIAQIAAVRRELRLAAPEIKWDPVFAAKLHPIPERRFLSGSAKVRDALTALLAGLQQLATAAESYGEELHTAKKPKTESPRKELIDLKEGPLLGLINAVVHPKSKYHGQAAKVLDSSGTPTRATLSRVWRVFEGSATLHENVVELVGKLSEMLEGLPQLAAPGKTFSDAWCAVKELAAETGVAAELASCDDYQVQMLDLDDVSNLVLGHQVSNCMSPTGEHSDALLERLAGGWFQWLVRNAAGEVTTIAWATLNQHKHLVIDFVDQRVNFRTPEARGNDMVEQLLAYAGAVAKATNVSQVWMARQTYGRLTHFPVFKGQTFETQDFVPLVATFLGNKIYVDKLKGKDAFVRLV